MEALKQIANVAGYSGLYRILKPGRSGVIVETLDDKKAKTMMGPTARVSVLNDISIYVDDDSEEQSVALSTVLLAVRDQYGDTLPVTSKDSNEQLADFMSSIVPAYDRDRVRTADIKKLISWYTILRQYAPEVFDVTADAGDLEVNTTDEPEIANAIVAEEIETPEADSTKTEKAPKA